jgi:hypothetical protein
MNQCYLLFIVVLFNCSIKSANDLPAQQPKEPEKKEKPITLSFPDYGIYIHNWPSYLRMANHGNVCSEDEISALFMILSGSAIVGTVDIKKEKESKKKLEEYSPFRIASREVIFNRNLDLTLETTGAPKLTVTFANLLPSYEEFFMENVSLLSPMTEATIIEVKLERLPLYVPEAQQNIQLAFDFGITKKTADGVRSEFKLWVRNEASAIGGICDIAADVDGELASSVGTNIKNLNVGDSITIFNGNRSRSWILIRTDKFVSIKDQTKNKVTLNLPLSEKYKWRFQCKKY